MSQFKIKEYWEERQWFYQFIPTLWEETKFIVGNFREEKKSLIGGAILKVTAQIETNKLFEMSNLVIKVKIFLNIRK